MTDSSFTPASGQGSLYYGLLELVRFAAKSTPSWIWIRANERSIDVWVVGEDANRKAWDALRQVGAAIADLEHALRCFLFAVHVEYAPDPRCANWVARLWITGSSIPAAGEGIEVAPPLQSVGRPQPAWVDLDLVRELQQEAASCEALLLDVDFGPPRRCLAYLLSEEVAGRPRWTDRAARWLGLRKGEEPCPEAVLDAPAVFLLASREDELADRVRGGQAMRRMMRRLHEHGLVAAEYPALGHGGTREEIAKHLHPEAYAQSAFYIGRI